METTKVYIFPYHHTENFVYVHQVKTCVINYCIPDRNMIVHRIIYLCKTKTYDQITSSNTSDTFTDVYQAETCVIDCCIMLKSL